MVTKIELLVIVETLKEYKGMLWGRTIKVYTDHKNLIADALGSTSNRVFQWRLLIEEYGPEIIYIKGEDNTVADAISRLDFSPKKKKHKCTTKLDDTNKKLVQNKSFCRARKRKKHWKRHGYKQHGF